MPENISIDERLKLNKTRMKKKNKQKFQRI